MTEGDASTPQPEPAASVDLEPVIAKVAENIGRHKGKNIGEQNTKLSLINPVLRALGWNVEDLEEVRHEFKRRPADKPVDYALMLARTPKLFVEAKALDGNLDDARWANQIIGYAMVAGVEWVVLTNGDEYRIYNSHAVAPVEEKLFRAVRITADPSAAGQALLLLTKEHIHQNALNGLWRGYAIDRKVKEAVDRLFAPTPSDWLVRRLAHQIEGLTQGEVRDALGRAEITFDFPDREPQVRSRRALSRPEPRREREPRKRARTPRPKEVSAVSVPQLIRARLIQPPLELRRIYKGHELSGRIEPDGRVSFDGGIYNSVSVAASMARKSVIGAPPGREYPSTNGWTFWRFRDSDGAMRELSVLRERFVAGSTPL